MAGVSKTTMFAAAAGLGIVVANLVFARFGDRKAEPEEPKAADITTFPTMRGPAASHFYGDPHFPPKRGGTFRGGPEGYEDQIKTATHLEQPKKGKLLTTTRPTTRPLGSE